MIRLLTTVLVLAMPLLCCAQQHVGTLLKAMPDGTIAPSNAVAYIEDISAVAAQAQAAISEAAIVMQLAAIVSNRADQVEALIAEREGIGYLRGGVESFEPAGVVHNTNIVASIVKFEKEVTATNVTGHIYTYFSEDPGSLPYTRVTRNVKNTNTWDLVASANVELDEVLVNGTLYECYRNDVFLPLSYSNAYFRVFADVQGVGTNQTAFQIYGGLKVGSYTGVDVEIFDGTNTLKWVGGVRVQ